MAACSIAPLIGAVWSKRHMDELFNSHVGPIPLVRPVVHLLQATPTKKTDGDDDTRRESLFENRNSSTLKRKRINDDVDDNPLQDDETDSHCERRRPPLASTTTHYLNAAKLFKSQHLDQSSIATTTTTTNTLNLWRLTSLCERVHKWKRFAKRLGLDKRRIRQIEWRVSKRAADTNNGPDECLYQCLVEHCKRGSEDNNGVDSLSIARLAERLGITNVASKLAELDERVRVSVTSYGAEYGEERMSSPPTDLDLWRLSAWVWDEWRALGRVLALDDEQLARVELRHLDADGPRECAYQMLLLAAGAERRVATFRVSTVVAALCEMGLMSCARRFLDSLALQPIKLLDL